MPMYANEDFSWTSALDGAVQRCMHRFVNTTRCIGMQHAEMQQRITLA